MTRARTAAIATLLAVLLLGGCGGHRTGTTTSAPTTEVSPSSAVATTVTAAAATGIDDADLSALDSALSQMDQNVKSADDGLAQSEG